MVKNECGDIQEMISSVWISGFWAQYNALPETYKEVFFNLIQSISKGLEKRTENENFYFNNNRRV
jgi:hypothetical protein